MFALAIAALVVAQAFDFVSFLVMTGRHGMAAEINPVVLALEDAWGLPGLTVVKVGGVLLVAVTFALIAPRRRRPAAFLMLVGIGAGLIGGISNVAST